MIKYILGNIKLLEKHYNIRQIYVKDDQSKRSNRKPTTKDFRDGSVYGLCFTIDYSKGKTMDFIVTNKKCKVSSLDVLLESDTPKIKNLHQFESFVMSSGLSINAIRLHSQ